MSKLDFQANFQHSGHAYHVRTMLNTDIEQLRQWKNKNRKFFSYKEIISPEAQARWYASFSQDTGQQIFLCTADSGEPLACVGFRLVDEDEVELFNLICAKEALLRTGFMTVFYKTVVGGLAEKNTSSIVLRVLQSNSRAIEWYRKQGFEQYGADDECLLLRNRIGR